MSDGESGAIADGGPPDERPRGTEPTLGDLLLRMDVRRILDRIEQDGAAAAEKADGRFDRVIDRISKASTFFSTVVLASVGLLFTSCNSYYQAQRNDSLEKERVANARLDIMKSFVQPVSNKEQRHVAIVTIATLGHKDLALKLAMLYPEDGYAAAISILASEPEGAKELVAYIRKSLAYIETECDVINSQINHLRKEFNDVPHGEIARSLKQLFDRSPGLRERVAPLDLARLATIEDEFFYAAILKLRPELRGRIKLIPAPQALVENGKRAVTKFRVYTDLFDINHISIFNDIDRKLEEIGKEAALGGAKVALLLRLLDVYAEAEDAIGEAEKNWGRIRDSFHKFVTEARASLDVPGRPAADRPELARAFQGLSDSIVTFRISRFQNMLNNANSIYQAIGGS